MLSFKREAEVAQRVPAFSVQIGDITYKATLRVDPDDGKKYITIEDVLSGDTREIDVQRRDLDATDKEIVAKFLSQFFVETLNMLIARGDIKSAKLVAQKILGKEIDDEPSEL